MISLWSIHIVLILNSAYRRVLFFRLLFFLRILYCRACFSLFYRSYFLYFVSFISLVELPYVKRFTAVSFSGNPIINLTYIRPSYKSLWFSCTLGCTSLSFLYLYYSIVFHGNQLVICAKFIINFCAVNRNLRNFHIGIYKAGSFVI